MAKACTLSSYLKTLADVKAKMKARLEVELIYNEKPEILSSTHAIGKARFIQPFAKSHVRNILGPISGAHHHMDVSIKNLDPSERDCFFPDNPVLAPRLKCPESPVIVNQKKLDDIH